MNIVLIGKPGCGKGTQNKLITERFNLISIISGDLLRTEKKSGSKLGKEIESIIDKGNLVPDEIIDKIIEEYLVKCGIKELIPTGYIFDGYPRTINQSKKLDELVDIDIVFFLDVDQDTLVKRILERGKTSGREDDQDRDIIIQRMDNYKKDTEPIKEYYINKLVTLDGTKDVDQIHLEIIKSFIQKVTEKQLNK